MTSRVLVAGVGNIFFGDDGFGPEVARVLASEPLEAKVEDFGIRGIHLSYELLNGYERAILIDAVPRGGAPGTLYVIEPDVSASGNGTPNGHTMDLQNVFAFVRTLGGDAPAVTIVGCEPETTEEGIGLSAPVAAAVEGGAALVRRLREESGAAQGRREGRETTCSEA